MSEEAGSSVAALRARQSALASQHGTAGDADRVLAEVLAGAHAVTRDSIRRLDAIAEEIDRAVLERVALAVDTPLGAHEFHKFLVAKLREIESVVAEAHEFGRAKSVVLDSLRAEYTGPGG